MQSFSLLAPAVASVPSCFAAAESNPETYRKLLAKLQRLRGRIYLEDGAIESWQLMADGRHRAASDERSWHLLAMEKEEVTGCARIQVYPPDVTFAELAVARSAQARSPVWGPALQRSVTAKLDCAQAGQLKFIEAGGWALTPELRCTTEALRIALGGYALGQLLGGCLGLSAATMRHSSASILRRLGGCPFMWKNQILPPYYDPVFRCEMEIIHFDSRAPNPRYRVRIGQLVEELRKTMVLCPADPLKSLSESLLSLAGALQAQPGQLRAATLMPAGAK